MSTVITWFLVSLAGAIVILLVMILAAPSDQDKTKEPGVSINATRGSVVTVRKVGRTTRVDIHPDIHDHWEGSPGVDIAPTPIELTMREEPELYAEYMNPRTSASRRYAIADYIYSLGLTLPYIHGMNEQWKREQEMNPAKGSQTMVNPITEPTPVNLHGGEMKHGIVMRKLDIHQEIREEPMYDMGQDPADEEETPVPEFNNEQKEEEIENE